MVDTDLNESDRVDLYYPGFKIYLSIAPLMGRLAVVRQNGLWVHPVAVSSPTASRRCSQPIPCCEF